jgi:CrcB protein
LAHVFDAPREIVFAALIFGLFSGVAEWLALRRRKYWISSSSSPSHLAARSVQSRDIWSVSARANCSASTFPWGTLIINISGSFLIGLFVGMFATRWDLPQAIRVFLTVGICGGYTTFSTFSLDAFYLMERGEAVAAGAYMVGSVVLSVGALIGAVLLVRTLQAP